jgi:hypothetical protein
MLDPFQRLVGAAVPPLPSPERLARRMLPLEIFFSDFFA